MTIRRFEFMQTQSKNVADCSRYRVVKKSYPTLHNSVNLKGSKNAGNIKAYSELEKAHVANAFLRE
jgi:hypothetical protein